MAAWWEKYVEKVPGVGVFYPDEDWVGLKSSNRLKLMTYRFNHPNPKALLFIFHGMFSESNESGYVAKKFNDRGYAVFSMDQEGHGKSGGRKGFIQSLDNYTLDSVKYIKKVKRRYSKDLPTFISGLSMGGTISAMISLSRPEIINGMLLFAPGLGVAPDFEPGLRRIVRCLNLCCGCLKLKKFDGSLTTKNQDAIQCYEDNPLNYTGRMDVRTAVAMLNGLEKLQRECHLCSVPVVAIQGDADKIVSVKETQHFIDTCISTDKQIWIYPEAEHVLFVEDNIDEIIERCIKWVDERI